MSLLSDRLARTRQAQQAAKESLEDRAAAMPQESVQQSYDTCMADFRGLFPAIVEFWQLTAAEQESAVRDGGQPENITRLVSSWMTDVVLYDIPVTGDLRQKCLRQFSLAVREMRACEQAPLRTPKTTPAVLPGAPAATVPPVDEPATEVPSSPVTPRSAEPPSAAPTQAKLPTSATSAPVDPHKVPSLADRIRALSKKPA